MNITELRKFAKKEGYQDLWWVCMGETTLDEPLKLNKIIREGNK
tara:strand:- start:1110 stop:1241 length:132 start_codon:yes stop_codon:yes gene_type:complete